jgi:hypothetical protein
LLAPFVTTVAPTVEVVSVALVQTEDAPTGQRADYVLPFATAPPTLRLA